MQGRLIVIAGTNASGKSGLGVRLAKRFDGEIVSADSRQVFRGLDLGSGKITKAEMENVPHHLIDVCDPGDFFSMADFQRLAYAAIDDILARGKVPFLVGGTGLYVDAVAEGYELTVRETDLALREKLETYDTPALYAMLREKLPDTEIDPKNRNRVMRALERLAADDYRPGTRSPRYETLKLGVGWPREILKERIDERLERRLRDGMVDEVNGLLDAGVSTEFLMKLGLEYRYLTRYLLGEMPYEQMVKELGDAIKKFAKRQVTWFKKDKAIHWLNMQGNPEEEAAGLIAPFLAGEAVPPAEELVLCRPDASMLREIAAYRAEFAGNQRDLAGVGALKRTADPMEWLADCANRADPARVPPGKVLATQFVYVRKRDQKIVGMIDLRHELNDYLCRFGGHIGYSVRPSERLKGYGTRMLAAALEEARKTGLSRVLVTCDESNEGSRKVILRNGGQYENTVEEPGEPEKVERYWITL